jgi:hypothetical protein
VSLIKDIADRIIRSYAGLGSANQRVSARRMIPIIGIGGAPITGTAGNGAAGAAVSIADYTNRDVYVSCEGVTRFRINAAPTAAIWHFSLPAGPVQPVHLPDDASTIQGWGVGGAWAFVVVPIDQET